MRSFGRELGELLRGGEVFELIGDVGAGKTTFTKGLAEGLDILEPVQSPTFTISRVYSARDNLELRHYDFYRLDEAGIMAEELQEALESDRSIAVIEWAGAVGSFLPENRLQLRFLVSGENERVVEISALGSAQQLLKEEVR